MYILVIAITTRACVVQANPARLGGYKWSLTTTTMVTADEDSATFNEEFAKQEEEPERPYYLDEDGGDARMSVSGSDDRYVMPPLKGEAEDFVDEAFGTVRTVRAGKTDRYKMPPVYSVQDLYDMKNGKGRSVEEGEIEEDDDEVEEE